MKKGAILVCCLMALFTISCKKDIEIEVEKIYVEKGAVGGELGFGGLMLTLMPDGKADFLFAGDILDRGTYTIKGKKITLRVGDRVHNFRVISETILVYDGDEPRVLELR